MVTLGLEAWVSSICVTLTSSGNVCLLNLKVCLGGY